MNKNISDFYTKVNMGEATINRIIATAETAEPRKSMNKTAAFVTACAAVLVIGLVSMLIFHMSVAAPNFTYENVSRFNTLGTQDNALILHDGFAVWISGAYFNGEKMYVALSGEYDDQGQKWQQAPDTLKFAPGANDDFCLTVNEEIAALENKEIVLKKEGKYFKGVVEIHADNQDSIVLIKMSIPLMEVYSNSNHIATANGPFEVEDIVSHIYTQNEKKLINEGKELYIQHIATFPRGAVSEPEIGLMIAYFIPDEIFDLGADITAEVYNEDGSEITWIQDYQTRKDSGYLISAAYGFPVGRNIKVILTDVNRGDVVQEYEVCLNAPETTFAIDD